MSLMGLPGYSPAVAWIIGRLFVSTKPHKKDSSVSAVQKNSGTIERVLSLLRILADKPGSTAQEIAFELDLPRSTVHRVLGTLRDNGFASHERGGFAPGLEMYRIAGRLSANLPFVDIAQPYLRSLSEKFGETSLLTLLERNELTMFHAANGSPSDPMRYDIQLNVREPLLWGATARAVLAYLSDDEVERVVSAAEPSPAQGVLPERNAVVAELADIRAKGYAITDSHRTPNTIGLAAPFFLGDGKVAGSLGLLIPSFRWLRADTTEMISVLCQSAADLSSRLGHKIR
jgi:DNA-binding IclR family transcriptional regulator